MTRRMRDESKTKSTDENDNIDDEQFWKNRPFASERRSPEIYSFFKISVATSSLFVMYKIIMSIIVSYFTGCKDLFNGLRRKCQ